LSLAIPYIRHHFPEGSYKKQFDKFWNYFVNTWMVRFPPETWNISHLLTDIEFRDLLIQRTNNPLERFNKKLNDQGLTHPSVMQLMVCLKRISAEYVDDLNIARRNLGRNTRHRSCVIHEIPTNYASWKVPTRSTRK
jgi:hypothetical protein